MGLYEVGPPGELFEFLSYGRSKGTKMWGSCCSTFPANKNFRPGKNRKVLRGVPPRRLRPAEAAVSATVSAKSQIHGTHASLTAIPWSHGSMGHPGRAPQPLKKKKTRGCRVYLASRTETATETAGAVRGGGFGTCAGIRTRAVWDR